MVPKNAPTMLHQPRGEHFFDHAVDHVLTMRFRASHGAGEGVLDTSFGASGAQEGALKMLNQPRGERILIMLFDHQKKLSTGLVKHFLLVCLPCWSPVLPKRVFLTLLLKAPYDCKPSLPELALTLEREATLHNKL